MLQIKNLSITYKKNLRELASDISFVLNDGDKAAVIGEEGNGKSTLLKLIYNEGSVKDYVEYSGEIIKNNCILGYLGQELRPEERKSSVYGFLSEEEGFLESGPKELAMYAKRLNIPISLLYSEQQMDTLSGGEKIKISMVRILCRKSDVLLLDEPSNDIDLNTLQWLEDFILAWKGPLMFVSHDEMLLERTANKIIHLEQIMRKKKARHTVSALDYKTYAAEREKSMKKQEQLARKERSEYKKQMDKFRQIEQKVEYGQDKITRADPHGGRLLKKKMHNLKSMERRFENKSMQMTEMPEAEEAIFAKFKETDGLPPGKLLIDLFISELKAGDKALARDLRLTVTGKEKVCIIGSNGVGKTTFIKAIASKLLIKKDIKAAYIPQNYEDIEAFRGESGTTPVAFLSESGDKEELTKIRTFLGSLKYTADEMEHPIFELSGGQKAKLLLLKLCISGANVLILDEPTRNFSPLSGPVVRRLFAEFPGAIISISHDRKYIEEVCDKVYLLTEEGLRNC